MKVSTLIFSSTYILCVNNVLCVSIPCGETYLAKNGLFCYPCGAGYYTVSDCLRNREQSICGRCEDGKYMPTCDNSSRCELCDQFCPDQKQKIVDKCTRTSNIKCQCIAGFYWKQHAHISKEGVCAQHSQCKAGKGVYRKGTPFQDTGCETCVEGKTFSSSISFDVCVPCTVCNVTLHKCSVTHDAICDSKADKNPDIEGIAKDDGNKPLAIAVKVVLPVIGVLVLVVVTVYICIKCSRRRNVSSNADIEMQRKTSDMGNGNVNISSRTLSSEILPDSSLSDSQQNGITIQQDNMKDTCQTRVTNNADKDSSLDNKLSFPETFKDSEFQQNLETLGRDEIYETFQERNNSQQLKIAYEWNEATDEASGKKGQEVLKGDHTYSGKESVKQTRSEQIVAMDINRISKNPNESKLGLNKHYRPENMLGEAIDEECYEGVPSVENKIDHTQEIEAESDSSTSMDAGHVSPRIVQPVSSSIDKSRYEKTLTNEVEATSETGCSHSLENGIVIQLNVSYVQTDHETQRRNSGNTTYISWNEVFIFLSTNIEWDKFKTVYRRLNAGTNNEAFSNIDVEIDNAEHEIKRREYTN